MKNWSVSGTKNGEQFLISDDLDWGAEIVNGVGINSISHVSLTNDEKEVMLFVRKGVITIGEQSIKLGINLGGYLHVLQEECIYTLEDLAPMKTAMYTYSTKLSENLGMHLLLKYKVTHVVDKATRKKVELDSPLIKEYLLFLDKYGYLTIC